MYELHQVGARTYYIDCPAKMGIYQMSDTEVCLIDSGNDRSAGKKVQKLLEEKGWALRFILNTHSHADHIGGNRFLQQKWDCPVYAAGIDRHFIDSPVLEPALLYGGFPCKKLQNKFLKAEESQAADLETADLPEGLSFLRLDGHAFSMTAVHTDDDVWFLADSLTSPDILKKYPVSYLYHVADYLASLDTVETLSAKLFIPAHAAPVSDIRPLVAANRENLFSLLDRILQICSSPTAFEEILKQVFDGFGLELDWNQYVLSGSTIRSCLSYLLDTGKLEASFVNNRLLWKIC